MERLNVNRKEDQFFQYKAFFETNTAGTSPESYNVTINGNAVVEPAELNIDSAWIDWNGNNV
ncbi:hypothetical protein FJZ53_01800 [Candidatus Woesearchaeota archaeon]|nr:hypothetical protein [Candidatus Woesearchaeota archaeon]